MKRVRLDRPELVESYGIRLGGGPSGPAESPAAAERVIEPGRSATTHPRDAREGLFVVRGRGRVSAGGETLEVGPGDVVLLERLERDQVTCLGDEPLALIDVSWGEPRAGASAPARTRDPVFVLCMPPTPNGDLHLGHISGPYLAADVHVRFLRMTGARAFFISGSDDHQSFVEGKAAASGTSPQEVADRYSAEIQATLAALDIAPDQFTRPLHDAGYAQFVARFIDRMIAAGTLRLGDSPGLVGCESGVYRYEYAVHGQCPSCGAGSTGNICEDCAMPNRCVDMIAPRSADGEPLEARIVRRWEMDLSADADFLHEHFRRAPMNDKLRGLLDQVLARVDRLPVSHPSVFGLPAPQVEGQVIWVWLEMAAGYLFGVDAVRRRHRLPTPDNPLEGAQVVNFFGIDNAFYVTILHTIAYHWGAGHESADTAYVCNEFYRLDGQKFSTSRRHAVWGRDLLGEVSADDIRAYLAATRPEGEGANFQLDAFRQASREAGDRWTEMCGVARTSIATSDGIAPAEGWTPEQTAFRLSLESYPGRLATCFTVRDFSLRRAARLLGQLVDEVNAFAAAEASRHRQAPRGDAHRTTSALLTAALRLSALLHAPLTPRRAQALWRQLGLPGEVGAQPWPDGLAFPASGLRDAAILEPAEAGLAP